jgi:CubicO group peptidase (beta-lactamase class C family)
MRTADYARLALFGPLGMDDSALNIDEKGHAWTYADMKTTPRDLARLGQLVLDRGRWKGERVLSEAYLDKALHPSPTNKEMGYLWWILYSKGKIIGFYASGYLNTDVYVLPANNIVIVRTQAPKNGFTGANESGDYFEKARRIFLELSGP